MNGLKISNNNFFHILKGFLISIILSVVCIWIYASILVKTNIKEDTITTVIIVISGISILIGSSISCLKIPKNGVLNGACVGLLYFLCLYLLSSIILCGFSISMVSVIMMVVGIALGAVGGIIGVNLKR